MWIFTDIGFYTVVENQDDKTTLILRARVKQDLVSFRNEYLPIDAPEIKFHLTYDYPYRLILSKEMYAAAMSKAIMNIDYRKFKESVHKKQGAKRFSFMNRLWSILIDLEVDKARIGNYFGRGMVSERPRNQGSRTTAPRRATLTTLNSDEPDWRDEYELRRNRYQLPSDSAVTHSTD